MAQVPLPPLNRSGARRAKVKGGVSSYVLIWRNRAEASTRTVSGERWLPVILVMTIRLCTVPEQCSGHLPYQDCPVIHYCIFARERD